MSIPSADNIFANSPALSLPGKRVFLCSAGESAPIVEIIPKMCTEGLQMHVTMALIFRHISTFNLKTARACRPVPNRGWLPTWSGWWPSPGRAGVSPSPLRTGSSPATSFASGRHPLFLYRSDYPARHGRRQAAQIRRTLAGNKLRPAGIRDHNCQRRPHPGLFSAPTAPGELPEPSAAALPCYPGTGNLACPPAVELFATEGRPV